MSNVTILFRCCDKVDVFSGGQRVFPYPKKELVLRCYTSLLRSVNRYRHIRGPRDITILIIDDHSTDDLRTKLETLTNRFDIPFEYHEIDDTGNAASLSYNYTWAKEHGQDLLYFLEDDYLHDLDSISESLQTYDLLLDSGYTREVILHPCDYPDRYSSPYASQILLGHSRHWRTIAHTTGTFMVHASVFREHFENYIAFASYGIQPGINEDNTINQIYKKVPCISPLPGLAVHLQYESTLSPFLDTKHLWQEADPNNWLCSPSNSV